MESFVGEDPGKQDFYGKPVVQDQVSVLHPNSGKEEVSSKMMAMM